MTALNIPARRPRNAETRSDMRPDSALPDSLAPNGLASSILSPSGAQTDAVGNEGATTVSRKKRAVYYPTGDGKPMAEAPLHRKQMAYCCDALELRFASRPDVHVSGNDFVYYEEGNPKSRVSPDCYVVFGVAPKSRRRFYKVWEENDIAPAVVFEITSKKTKKEDVSAKRPLYEQILRVAEYFQFDPTGDYLRPRLQGQRLTEGTYQPIELRSNRMTSGQLGLELVIEGETLRFYDPASGEFLRTYQQAETQRMEEARRAESEKLRAEQQTQRALAADRRAEEEKQRAQAAEAELDQLRQELNALRQQKSSSIVEDRPE